MKIVSSKALHGESKALAAADLTRRQGSERILTPEMVGVSGRKNTAAAAKLLTTLGGKPRPITTEDLHVFKRAVSKLQADRKNIGGILAKEVVAQSTPIDLARSKDEINHAVPFRFAAGNVSFQTSASRKYAATRHIVQVELSGWSQAVGSPATTLAAAKTATEQPVRFECDCGRHTFFYRYIATIGGWNHGRVETGFPKIKNPTLSGVACKHVLRVMVELDRGGAIRGLIARAIRQERERLAGKTRKTVLSVEKSQASKITTVQAAKPRDVEKVANKLKALLMGKIPKIQTKPMTREALEREAVTTRTRLLAMGVSRADADRVAAAILSTKPTK